MADEVKFPRIGVGVFVLRDGKFLMGLRHGSHGADTWSLPGGHLEWNESFEDCATREVAEETGLTIARIRHLAFTNDRFEKEQKHYVTLFVTADWSSGEPAIVEPDKCKEWRWVDAQTLPQPLFLPMQNLVDQGVRIP